jgi:hypothetical protein
MKKKLEIHSPLALGLSICKRYYFFLLQRGLREDIEQVIYLAEFLYPVNKDIKAFDRAVTRGLYRLANDYGYRKPQIRMNETGGWMKKEVQLSELDLHYKEIE